MITKQQALEFIYDLSQKTEIMLDVSCGEMQFDRICDGDYSYTSFANESTLEATVTKCIKEHMDAIMNYVDKIPVDVDMLEVGQTYKVFLSDKCTYGLPKLNKHTYLGEKDGYHMFERTEGNVFDLKQEDIEEIYKVNECTD